MKKITIAATLLLAGLSANANAEFITGDNIESGDSTLVLDTSTGLEWLKLTETLGMSISNLELDIENGAYSGFRLATEDEVALMFDQFLSEDQSELKDGAQFEFLSLFGFIQIQNLSYSYGLVQGDGVQNSLYGIRHHGGTLSYLYRAYELPNYEDEYSHPYYGAYLVSDTGTSYSAINDSEYNEARLNGVTAVPVPFMFSFLAMLPMFVRRKLKKA